MIDLNCKALVAMTELTLPYMKRGAKLLNLDSLSAFQPVPYLNVYASTKAFVLSYTRSLARELRPRGIRVMAVSPGWVKTEFFDHALQTSNDAVTYYNRLYEGEGRDEDGPARPVPHKEGRLHPRPARALAGAAREAAAA